jgi:uncharacterized protein (DUF1330 family)
MATINPTREQIARFEQDAPDQKPIVMLNLLRFRDVADYGAHAAASDGGVTGRKAYDRYSKAVMPLLFEVGGLPLWMGKGRAGVIVPEGESWDEVLLVHYPSRAAFVRMVRSSAYQSIMHHRTAALADSRLVETRAMPVPRWILRAARAGVRVKAALFPKIPA